MAENKTKETKEEVAAFIERVPDDNSRADAALLARLCKITKARRASHKAVRERYPQS